MSVQFGRWNVEGQPPSLEYIEKVSAMLAPYGPDSNEHYANGGVTMLYRAFHTTKESHREVQPHVTASGAVITWDGRLDNRAELIGELRELLGKSATASRDRCSKSTATAQLVAADFSKMSSVHEFTDVEIVAAAYERWGPKCLGRLIGDWALAIWNSRERSVLLAKDPIGTKHLYYSIDERPSKEFLQGLKAQSSKDEASERAQLSCAPTTRIGASPSDSFRVNGYVTWSTILDPLVLHAGHTFEICEEYIAGWYATGFPAAHLTPYVGVHAVPPSCSVLLRTGKYGVRHTISKHWDFDPANRIRYRTDAEYEEHFRSVFATAVQRRLRSDRPVLAELSGGIDSSSIVCMADLVIARGQAECPRLDTITWYDESKPNWGEIPHFTKVEEKRGRIGHHINDGALPKDNSPVPFGAEFLADHLAATPLPNARISEFCKQTASYIRSQAYRITLSGIGGGEFTGDGVPTPSPEFQNLLARARFVTLHRQLKAWAAKMKKPRLPLLWDALQGFLPLTFQGLPDYVIPAAPWFQPNFVRRNRTALRDYPQRTKFLGALPSFQDNFRTLNNSDRRLLATWILHPELLYETRFPFLDRDFLEFAFAIPREQTVRVGQRRFLIKRALVGIVPGEILNRKKREALPQGTPKNVAGEKTPSEWPSLEEMGWCLASSSTRIVDADRFLEALQKARRNEAVQDGSLRRTLMLESWLRHLIGQGVLKLTGASWPVTGEKRSTLVSRQPFEASHGKPVVPSPSLSASNACQEAAPIKSSAS
jgi:asparagine synthase (glutamine-hydrolysing)